MTVFANNAVEVSNPCLVARYLVSAPGCRFAALRGKTIRWPWADDVEEQS